MPSQHIPFKPEVEKFEVKDDHFSNQQKHYHDLRYRANKNPTTLKRTTCVDEDSYNQRIGDGQNATPRSVVVQIEQGSQSRTHTQLRRRSWKNYLRILY